MPNIFDEVDQELSASENIFDTVERELAAKPAEVKKPTPVQLPEELKQQNLDESRKLAASSRWQEMEAKAADLLANPVTRAFADPLGSFIKASGTAGRWLAGKTADITTAVSTSPRGREAEALLEGIFGSNRADLQQAQHAMESFEELPVMEELRKQKGKGPAFASAALGTIESAPLLAAGMAANQLGGPVIGALAFSTLFGLETYEKTGDPVAAMQSAGTGLVIPPFARAGMEAGSRTALRLGIESRAGQKALEAIGHQAALQATAHVAATPGYAQMNPEERKRAALETTFTMLLFAAFEAGKINPEVRSLSEQNPMMIYRLASKALDSAMLRPEFKARVDQIILDSLDPRKSAQLIASRGARVTPPEGAFQLGKYERFPTIEEFEAAKEEARAMAERADLKAKVRSGNATPAEMAEWAKIVGQRKPRPEVPANFERDLTDLFVMRGGKPEMNINEVLKLMPELSEKPGRREQARKIRDQAFPKEERKEPPKAEVPKPEEPLTSEKVEALKRETISKRIAAGINPDELVITFDPGEFIPEKNLKLPAFAQVDERNPRLKEGELFSANPDLMRELGFDMPTVQELVDLKIPRGKYTLTQIRELQKRKDVSSLGTEPSAPVAEKAPAVPERPPGMSDYDRYNQLTKAIRTAPPELRQSIFAEIEEIKNRNGGMPPVAEKPPVVAEKPPVVAEKPPVVAEPTPPVSEPTPAPPAPPAPAPAPVPPPAEPSTPPPAKEPPPPVPPGPAPAPGPIAAPPPAPPAQPTPPAAPKPVIKPSGMFGDKSAKDALDALKRKKPAQPPAMEIAGVETIEGVTRVAEDFEIAEAVEKIQKSLKSQARDLWEADTEVHYSDNESKKPEGEVQYPGEPKSDDVPLYEQETLGQLTTVGGSILEGGFLTYPEWYKAMTETVGPEYRHYFRRAYNQLRDVPALYETSKMMTPREEVELYNDAGEKIGLGAVHRPGLIVRNEALMPPGDPWYVKYIVPNRWIGKEGDSIDWTQAKAIVMGLTARANNNPAILIADGPGVGKSGIGAALAHMLTYPVRESLDSNMGKLWEAASPRARARWLGPSYVEGEVPKYEKPKLGSEELYESREFGKTELDRMRNTSWEMLRPEQKEKVYRNYGFNDLQISEDNVHAGTKERGKVLVVGVNQNQIVTSFIPDFEKFGIPLDNIEFVTYSLFSNPGPENSKTRKLFDRIVSTEWNAVIFDEAHALKNAGSSREHHHRKLKTKFRVYMTATPMDNVSNAAYFMSEITGIPRDSVLESLQLRRIVKVIGGEDREFIVQKPGVTAKDVTERIIKMREDAIRKGLMIRREFPWWGEVVGKETDVPLIEHFQSRWDEAPDWQKADWVYSKSWDLMTPEQKAQLLLPSLEAPEKIPDTMFEVQSARESFTPAELQRMADLKWESLRNEQKAKIFRNKPHDPPNKWTEQSISPDQQYIYGENRQEILRNAGYSLKEINNKTAVIKGKPGAYWLDPLTSEESGILKKIWDKYEEEMDKAKSMIKRRNLSGMRLQEMKRVAETYKAKRVIDIVERELKAGRNVVIYGNTVNDFYAHGTGETVQRKVEKQPNPDWMKFQGSLGLIAEALEKKKIPYSKIFGSVKDIKTEGIKQFYSNQNRVALITPESGGAGLNLDDVIGRYPRTLIVVDVTFKGDTFEQLMYRVSRRNTASESKAYILMFPDSYADAHIRRKMNYKLGVLRGMQAGKDTDFSEFLEDLNNPADMTVGEKWKPDPGKVVTDFPVMKWEEVVQKSGRKRWRAEITPDFEKWWNQNGGQKNALKLYRTIGGRYYEKPYVWSNTRPDFAPRPEPKPGGEGLAESSPLGKDVGYTEEPKYAKYDYEELVDQIEIFENLAAGGFDPAENMNKARGMRDELSRRRDLDARTDQLLQDNPEYNEINEILSREADTGTIVEDRIDLEARRKQIVSDTAQDVAETVPVTPVEQIPMVSPPGTVPIAVVPKSLIGNPKSMYQIGNELKKALGIPFRFGSRIGGGFYNPVADFVRVKRVSDSGAVFHEGGHKLDAIFRFRDNALLQPELDKLGDPSLPNSRSSWNPHRSLNYKYGEGVAEFMRRWIFEPDVAKALAPNFYRVWEAFLDANEKDFGFMRGLQKDVQTYLKSPLEERFDSHIVRNTPDSPKLNLATLVYEALDQYHYIKIMSDAAFDASRGGIRPLDDAYLLFRNLAGNFGRAEVWVTSGIVDFRTGNVKYGTSLMHALHPVRDRLNQFERWIVAKQAREMMRKGQEPGIPSNEINDILTKYNGIPEFETALNKIQEWQDALLLYIHDAKMIGWMDYVRMKRENAIYIPMKRFYELGFSEAPIESGGGGSRQIGRVGKPSPLKSRTGSERPIMAPLASMMENAYWMINAAEKNKALNALSRYEDVPGMGKWIERVSPPTEKVMFQLGRIRSQLKGLGINTGGVSDETLLWFIRSTNKEVIGKNTIRIKDGDQFKYYQLDPNLYKSVMAADKITMTAVMRILASPAQLLRAGVTLDPSFALWRNIVRDTVSAAVISRHSIFPFEASMRGAWALLAPNLYEKLGFKSQADAMRTMVAEWKASGGMHAVESTFFDRDKLLKFYTRELGKRDATYATRGLFIVKHPLEALRMLTQVGEQSTRIGEYQKVYNKLIKEGWEPINAHLQASFESRDLQDFSMQGANTVIQGVKMLVPFWNAAVQGRYRFYRSFVDKRNPDVWKSTLLKGGIYVMLPKLIEQWINWDNQDYWDKPRWQRSLFYHIPISKTDRGTTRFLLIPVPFEAGVIFASLPGAILEYVKQRNIDSATAFGSFFIDQQVDSFIPQWVTLGMELAPELGWDYFQNRPLMPRGFEKEPYWARWNDSTSLTAKKLSTAFNKIGIDFSPAKIEHFVRRSTGGLGTAVMHQGVDRILSLATGEKRAPLPANPFRTIVTPKADPRSQIIEDFYDKLSALQREQTAREKHRVWNRNINVRELDEMLKIERMMAQKRRSYRGTYDEAKRERLMAEMENLARRFVRKSDGTYKEYRVNRMK